MMLIYKKIKYYKNWFNKKNKKIIYIYKNKYYENVF